MWKKGIRVIMSFVVVLLVWQIACTVTNANATLFPSPVKVGEEFVKLFTQGLEGSTSHVTLPGHIRISLLRFATGYVLGSRICDPAGTDPRKPSESISVYQPDPSDHPSDCTGSIPAVYRILVRNR